MFDKTKKWIRRKGLVNENFSIISDNCWGGFVYQYFGMPYLSPFIGLFVFSSEYVRMLQSLEDYMREELRFIVHRDSKFAGELVKNGTLGKYPIGILGDVELHFLHYDSEDEAYQKWRRRVSRINYENLLVKMCDRDLCTESLINDFCSLNYKNKVCITSQVYDHPECLKLKNEEGYYVENEWNNFKITAGLVKFMNNYSWTL